MGRYKMRKQPVEPVLRIVERAMGFIRFHLRGLTHAASEWRLIALAYNCRRPVTLLLASFNPLERHPDPTGC